MEILKEFPYPWENIVVLMKFGSHLYGTATEESDIDYKGIFIPPYEDILLQRVPKAWSWSTKKGNEVKNTADDVEVEMFSLHHFIDLACKGEMIPIDMLHTPCHWPDIGSYTWKRLLDNRGRFYTKSMKAFVGYARKQAAKYGIRGSRLADAEKALLFLKQLPDLTVTLWDIWEYLPEGEHIHFIEDTTPWMYQVCGKKFQATCKLGHVIPILEKFVNEYGHRARQAKENEGIDWKAVSHALRAAYQIKWIFYGDGDSRLVEYPIPEAPFLLSIKKGEQPWYYVKMILEQEMKVVEKIAERSNLPDKVSRKFWDTWLLETLRRHYENEK